MAAMFYESFVLRNKMAAVLSFSPVGVGMAEEHVYFPSVCGGRGPVLQTQLSCGH